MIHWLLALAQTLLFIAMAPFLLGWIKRVKCHMQNRAAPSLWQPYRDLGKLFRKHVVLAEQVPKVVALRYSERVAFFLVGPLRAVTDPQGRFYLANISPGRFRLVLPAHPQVQLEPIELRPGEDLQLPPIMIPPE